MSRRLGRAGKVAFALLVAGGLTFGARSALAAPQEAACPYHPTGGMFGYTCSTVSDCNARCPYPFGNLCMQGCCTCSL